MTARGGARPAVVAPLDGTADGERALGYAAVAARRLGAALDLVHVLAPGSRHEPARAYLAAAAERVAAGGDQAAPLPVQAHVLTGEPGPALAAHAQARSAPLVALATRARGAVLRAVVGSVALAVVRTAPCPVLLVPPDAAPDPDRAWPGRVLVATDGAPEAEDAFAPLAPLAAPGAGGAVLAVAEPLVVPTSLLSGGGAVGGGAMFGVAAVAARLRALGLALEVDERASSRPARAVAEAADARGADLIAVATHGRRGFERLFGGSVAEEVVGRAACPVWVGHLRA